jgi:paraquat-inducible protein A
MGDPDPRTMDRPLSQRHPDAWELFKWLALLQSVAFGVGLFAPMMTLRKGLWIFQAENTYSVLGGIGDLFTGGNLFIALLISIFTVIFPILKIALLMRAWLTTLHARSARIVAGVELLGKWSMLDVFVVALLVCLVKLGDLVKIEIRWGLYSFCASVLLGMFASWLTHRMVKPRSRSTALPSSEDPKAD